MNSFGKNLALWIIIGLLLVSLFNLFQSSATRSPHNSFAYSEFVDRRRTAAQVARRDDPGQQISGKFTDGRTFSTYAPNDPNLVDAADRQGRADHAAPATRTCPRCSVS